MICKGVPMARVRLEINRRPYDMVAEDGQEAHVAALGEEVAKRVKSIVHQVGQVGEGRVILMAALQLADEQRVLRERIEQLEAVTQDNTASQAAIDEARSHVAQVYGDLADKIEGLVQGLE